MASELISISKELYDKMESMKLGKRDSFTKVIDFMFSEIKQLKNENVQLLKEKITRIESNKKKV